MTTWHDQQPQSRRALRESERARSQATMHDSLDEEITNAGFDQQIWKDQPVSPPREFPAKVAPTPTPSEEPLRRPRGSGSTRPASSPVTSESPAYRLRDFSPESRGSSFSSTQSAPWTPPSPGSEDLSYKTSADITRSAPKDSSAPTPAPPVVVTPDDIPVAPAAAEPRDDDGLIEHTLTRRELREIRNAAAQQNPDLAMPDVAAPEVVAPIVATPATSPPPAPRNGELDAAMAEFDDLFQKKPEVPFLEEPAEEQPTFTGSVAPPSPVEPPVADAAPESVAPGFDWAAPVAEPVAPVREVVTAPEVNSAPVGHWSTQAMMDVSSAPVGRPHVRDISSSDAITTSALILPSFPASAPVTGPVSGTGETLMTGSINLPRSLGVTGLHPSRYDRPDIDDIIDAVDRENVAPDSAPVRAVRAVSTYTSSQAIINAKRPKGNNLPMVLSITAGVMMVGVVVLVVVGMVFKIF